MRRRARCASATRASIVHFIHLYGFGSFSCLLGPLTFSLFAHGFSLWNGTWLAIVLTGVFIAAYFGQLPGCEPRPYILRFDEDRPNPLYRRICYTFAWNAVINFALLNLAGLVIAAVTGQWLLKEIYTYAYSPICAIILCLGLLGKLPRVGPSTKREGTERRYFYGSVWAVTISQTILLIVWKMMPTSPDRHRRQADRLCRHFGFHGHGSMAGNASAHPPHPSRRNHGLRLARAT